MALQKLNAGTQMGGGGVVQRVHTQSQSHITNNTEIPNDSSIPQIGEGTEVLSAVITPKSASNILRCDVSVIVSQRHSININIAAALFKDSGPDAIAVGCGQWYVYYGGTIRFVYELSAASTSSQTFSVRVGSISPYTWDFNRMEGGDSGKGYGGKEISSITIWEIAA